MTVGTGDALKVADEAANHGNLTAAVMLNQRARKCYKKLKEIIVNGEIGKIKTLIWNSDGWYRPDLYYRSNSWRGTYKGEGGGVLVNQAIHHLDLLSYLIGNIKSVSGIVREGYMREVGVDTDSSMLLCYENGATGIFNTSVHNLLDGNRLEIIGTGGTILLENESRLTIKKLFKAEPEWNKSENPFEAINLLKSDSGQLYSEKTYNFERSAGSEYEELLQNFVDNILSGTPLIAPIADGVASVRLANACMLSSEYKKQINLDFDPTLFDALLERKQCNE